MSEGSQPGSRRPIIIVRKAAHSDFHGGSWKVAFADFMTAMFALFLTLWILTQSQEVKTAVASYFRHPTDYEGKPDAIFRGNDGLVEHRQGRLDLESNVIEGPQPGGREGFVQTPQTLAVGAGRAALPSVASRPQPDVEHPDDEERDEIRSFLRLTDELWKTLGLNRKFKDNIRIEAHEDGLLIQLVSQAGAPLLIEQGSTLAPPIKQALALIAAELGKRPRNKLEISGHDWTPEDAERDERKWVASAALADLARTELVSGGLRAEQISRIAGCADAHPLNSGQRRDPLNQRIAILVRPRQWRPETW